MAREWDTRAAHEGYITIKLFNILAGEIGHVLIGRGISVEALKLADFIRLNPHKARLVSVMTRQPGGDPAAFISMLEGYDTRKIEIIVRL